jgi:hypothetical protein
MTTDFTVASDKTAVGVDNRMRARQLVATVRQGRRIGFDVLDEGWFFGYLAGWDDETYFLLEPKMLDGSEVYNKLLIPKNHILAIQLVDERTFREEPLFEDMELIVKPFRDLLSKQYPRS